MAWHFDGGLTIMDTAGNVLSGRNCLIYSDRACTSQVTTVTLYDGTTVSGGVIPSAADGRVRWAETTQTYRGMYLKAPDGQVYFVPAEEAILTGGSGGGGNVSDNTTETITAAWTFSTNPTFNNGAIPQAKVANLTTDLAAAANPVQRANTANQAAMLALTANKADWTYRTDTASVWMLLLGTDPTVLGNWVNLGAATSQIGYAALPADVSLSHTGPSTDPRPTTRSDLPVTWNTVDGVFPANAISGVDKWENSIVVPVTP